MIRQMDRFQFAQNISGLSGLCGGSMNNHKVLASLQGRLVGDDAVSRYAYAIQAGADSTQTAYYHRILQGGDDPSHQRTANKHRANGGHPKKCGAKQ